MGQLLVGHEALEDLGKADRGAVTIGGDAGHER